MSLQTRLSDFITAVGTDYKNFTTYMFGSLSGTLADLTTTDKSSFVAAINEVKAAVGAGSPTTLDDLTDVTITSPATGNIMRFNGTVWVNVVGSTYFDVAGAAASAQSASQPLDSDLTAIGGLTPSNDDIIQRKSGAWINRTMAQLKTDLALSKSDVGLGSVDNVQQLPMSYLDTDGTLAANSDTKVASQKAARTYIDGIIAAANAMVYKGVQDASANPNWPAADAGWTYTVSVAGKMGGASGQVVEVGDLLICKTDGTASGNDATVGANWQVVQKNIDGAVVGPASSTASNLPMFNGTSGKVIQDSGVAISVDGTMASNVDTKVTTEKGIRTYLAANYYTQTQLGNYDTDLAAAYTTAKS